MQARYYFGQPVANGRVHYVVRPAALLVAVPVQRRRRSRRRRRLLRRRRALRRRPHARRRRRAARSACRWRSTTNGRDYRARIEARVTDASGREVTGAGLVQATYGSFLVAARLDQYMARPGATVTLSARDARLHRRGRAPTCRSGCWSNASTTPTATTTRRRSRRSATPPPRTDAAGQLSAPIRVPDAPGSYRVAVVAPRGPARPPRRRLAVGAGPVADAGQRPTTSTSSCWPTSARYAPGDTARIVVRGRDVVGPGAADQGRPARVVAPGGAAHASPARSRFRSTDGDLGDVYVHVVLLRDGRLLQAERRLAVPPVSRTLQIALTAGPAGGQAAGTGELRRAGDRRRRPAGAGQRQPGGDRRGGVRREGRRHARSGPRLLPPRVLAGEHGVLARLLLHRATRAPTAAAGLAAPAAAVAGRLQGRPAGPAAGAQGVPRCDPLGGVAGHRRRRGAAASPCAIPIRSRRGD